MCTYRVEWVVRHVGGGGGKHIVVCVGLFVLCFEIGLKLPKWAQLTGQGSPEIPLPSTGLTHPHHHIWLWSHWFWGLNSGLKLNYLPHNPYF